MSKTQEIKVAELLVNLSDDHWFNPAIFGRYLAEQPLYTVDRIMEMVAYIISEQTKTYELQKVRGTSSEGLLLANELNECIKAYQEVTVISNLTLPKPTVYNIKREEPVKSKQYGWIDIDKNPFDQV
jgi:pyrimidine operon attenuation protein/uracil phosphoribosyltransferase